MASYFSASLGGAGGWRLRQEIAALAPPGRAFRTRGKRFCSHLIHQLPPGTITGKLTGVLMARMHQSVHWVDSPGVPSARLEEDQTVCRVLAALAWGETTRNIPNRRWNTCRSGLVQITAQGFGCFRPPEAGGDPLATEILQATSVGCPNYGFNSSTCPSRNRRARSFS